MLCVVPLTGTSVQQWGLGHCDASKSSTADVCSRERLQKQKLFTEASDQCLL